MQDRSDRARREHLNRPPDFEKLREGTKVLVRLRGAAVPDATGTDHTDFFEHRFLGSTHGNVRVQDTDGNATEPIVVPSTDVSVHPMGQCGSGVQFEDGEAVLARWARTTGFYAAEVLRGEGNHLVLRFANDPGHEDGRRVKVEDVFRHPPGEDVDTEDSNDVANDLCEALDEGSDGLDPIAGDDDDGAGEEPETGDDGDGLPAGDVPGRGAPTPRPQRGPAVPVTQSAPRRPRPSTGPAPAAPQKAQRYSLRSQGPRGTQ